MRMSLPAHQLDAFYAVAELKSFSKAASRLGVTQPALSQRIHQLEDTLKKRLFIRGQGGVRLTEAGNRLLRYCHAQRALEGEILADLAEGGADAPGAELTGAVRVAGFSSVVRSCVLPALSRVARENPRLSIELCVREIEEVAELLTRGATDFAILDHTIERPDVDHVVVGQEELVLIESEEHRQRDDVYLDHDAGDPTTLRFLKRARKSTRVVERSFLDDIYGILDGVSLGLGRAVVSRHLVAPLLGNGIRLIEGPKLSSTSPVILHWFRQPSYPRAHDAVRKALEKGLAEALA
jgi:DNA-binding transcriptional LysR family regulator